MFDVVPYVKVQDDIVRWLIEGEKLNLLASGVGGPKLLFAMANLFGIISERGGEA